ncbi:alternative ribosome rescue aminoacyl-tRNA hydrolase ArfB [Synechococcus sp. MIT S9503]|uniref:alternative ribosome rescue aminoacyl-tRNA hydrolase ArfB n=1 Tax=Synechococcus sp. MIT S9503 TaxID=3082547 RepID=UPI0039A5AD3B
MIQDLPINDRLVIPAAELEWRFSRSSGPGGQGVNTTDSRVELRFDLESSKVLGPFRKARLKKALVSRMDGNCLRVVAAEERSQWQNRQKAMARLADLLREGLKPPPPKRRPTRPGRAAVRRRLEAKGRRSELKRRRQVRPSLDD